MLNGKFANVELPTIPTTGDIKVENVSLEDLMMSGQMRVTHGLNVGDTFEFPDTIEECNVVSREVRPGGPKEYLLLGFKNGKPAYLSLSNLRRRDCHHKPVHPVSEVLAPMSDDKARVLACLGKTITATETVTFDEAVFTPDGERTADSKPRTTAKIIFA